MSANDLPQLIATLVCLAMMIYLLGTVLRFNAAAKTEPMAEDWRKRSDRMLTAVGVWQWSVAGVLIAGGYGWVNSIGLIGVGLLMIVGVRVRKRFDRLLR